MAQKRIRLHCLRDECKQDEPTELIIEVTSRRSAGKEKKGMVVYCRNNHPNKILVPANWEAHPPVLGEDIVAYAQDVPIFEGRSPYDGND